MPSEGLSSLWHLPVDNLLLRTGPVFCLLLGVSSAYAQSITGQVTEVTCPVIGREQPEHTRSKRRKTGPGPQNIVILPVVLTPGSLCLYPWTADCCFEPSTYYTLPRSLFSSTWPFLIFVLNFFAVPPLELNDLFVPDEHPCPDELIMALWVQGESL